MTPTLIADDQDFVDCLRRIKTAYEADDAITDDQRHALAVLVNSYTCDAESDFGPALARKFRCGMSVDDLRTRLAEEAGIADLDQLKFFVTVGRQLDTGALESVDVTDLSDAEYLALFQPK